MLRKAVRSHTKAVAEEWRSLQYEELQLCIAHQYYLHDQLTEDDMGEGCDLYEEEC
jgi:hypothetical protein